MIGPRVPKWQAARAPGIGEAPGRSLHLLLAVLALLTITAWSYWPVLAGLFDVWQNSDDYSAGQLVPLVAILFVWRDRKALGRCSLVPCWWGGIALLLWAEFASLYLFLAGAHPSLEKYLLVLVLAGLVLWVAGRQVFRQVLWILLFLFLMFPLPGRIHNLIGGPLQQMATTGSVSFLEAFGVSASQQGNVVVLNGNMPIAVAEACSGLRLLTAFIIVAAFIAYLVKRPRWQKGVLLVSSIPVAVVCNMLRIFATAVLMLYVSAEVAQKFFHDFAGYVMMPVAVMLLFGEIWLMDRIVVPEPPPRPGRASPSTRRAAGVHKASAPERVSSP
jgi:exosortase